MADCSTGPIYALDDAGNKTATVCATSKLADPRMARFVIDASDVSEDGRSRWLWVRLANGDLLLACYPQGGTYEIVEDMP